MTGEGLSRMPPRCEGVCPLTDDDIARHGLTVRRNCDGPSYDHEVPVTSQVTLRGGEIVDEVPYEPPRQMGTIACTNTGFVDWIKLRKTQRRGENPSAS